MSDTPENAARPQGTPPVLPRLRLAVRKAAPPSEALCRSLWDDYDMPEHIRAHSLQVARFAAHLAALARERGMDADPAEAFACGLLHDIAKNYTILHGGSHAQLGAAWTLAETGHYTVARGVLHHVCWPWPVEERDVCGTVFFVMYADKRTMHSDYVTIEERYRDLLLRYGMNEQARRGIAASRRQAGEIERALGTRLGLRLGDHAP